MASGEMLVHVIFFSPLNSSFFLYTFSFVTSYRLEERFYFLSLISIFIPTACAQRSLVETNKRAIPLARVIAILNHVYRSTAVVSILHATRKERERRRERLFEHGTICAYGVSCVNIHLYIDGERPAAVFSAFYNSRMKI